MNDPHNLPSEAKELLIALVESENRVRQETGLPNAEIVWEISEPDEHNKVSLTPTINVPKDE